MLVFLWWFIYIGRLEYRQVNNNVQILISGFIPVIQEDLYVDLHPALLVPDTAHLFTLITWSLSSKSVIY